VKPVFVKNEIQFQNENIFQKELQRVHDVPGVTGQRGGKINEAGSGLQEDE